MKTHKNCGSIYQIYATKSVGVLAIVISVMVIFSPVKAFATTWASVGSPGFTQYQASWPVLKIDNAGNIYFGYRDQFNFKGTVMKYDGSTWTALGGARFTTTQVSEVSMAIDSANNIYFGYQEGINPNYKAGVMMYNGTSWSTIGTSFSTGQVNYTSMAVDGSDNVYIGYSDQGNGLKATVKKYTGGGSWTEIGGPNGLSGSTANDISLAAYGTTLYIAYQDQAFASKATVMSSTAGGPWSPVGGSAGISDATASYTSMAVDSAGTPYVAYRDWHTSSGTQYGVTVKKYFGGSWQNVGSPRFTSAGLYVSLAIDGTTPYVAYADAANGFKATVMKFDGANWVAVGSAFSDGTVNGASMAVNSSGVPYVGYWDATTQAACTGSTSGCGTVMTLGYDVTVTKSGSGTITGTTPSSGSVDGSTATYVGGTNVSLTATPATHYTFTGWSGDCAGTGTCDINAIAADKAVTATFTAAPQYTVTATAGTGGDATPASQSVYSGDTTTVTVTPDYGYYIDSISGCGGTTVTGVHTNAAHRTAYTYTTGAISGDCAVTAAFTALPSYTVTPSAGAGGSISPATPQSIYYGSQASFTITAGAHYVIDTVTGCGGSLTGTTYTTAAVTANCSVTASFLVDTSDHVTAKSAITSERAYSSSATVNGTIYMFGGNTSTSWGKILKYYPTGDSWTVIDTSASGCLARYSSTAAAVDGYIYIIGGRNSSGTVVSTLEKFDPTTSTCSTLSSATGATFPATENMASSVFNSKIYVTGGLDDTGTLYSADLYVYDTIANSWTKKASMSNARTAHTSAVVNGKIYVFGGHTAYSGVTGYNMISAVEIYDIATNTWAVGNNSSFTPRAYLASGVMNGVIYLFGGATNFGSFCSDFPTCNSTYYDFWGESVIEAYNVVNDTWLTPQVGLSSARYGITASELNGKMYILGGYYCDISAYCAYFDDNDQYTPLGGTGNSSIKVTISPYSAISSGARWGCTGGGICDGTKIFGSGDTASVGSEINYTVLFEDLGSSFTTPASVTIPTIAADAVSLVKATYKTFGSFTARIFPVLLRESAKWTIDGGANWYVNDTLTGLTPGTYTLSFKTIGGGYTRPSATSVIINGGYLTTAAGTYKSNASDFNGDGVSDMVFRNSQDASMEMWLLNGGRITARYTVSPPTGDDYTLMTSARDFNGDGMADMLWKNKTTGKLLLWTMNGERTLSSGEVVLSTTGVAPTVSADWSDIGFGDFNADGMADILWRNKKTGKIAVWLMSGNSITSGAVLSQVNSIWSPLTTGDFNGDGTDDILWRSAKDASLVVWWIKDAKIDSYKNIAQVNATWKVEGAGDFNSDRKDDLLWRNSATNQTVIWLMNGDKKTGAYLGAVDSQWNLAALGDYNADEKCDIAWRHPDGNIDIWFMNGYEKTSETTVGN